MRIAKTINELSQFISENIGNKIGFVPTMGALHQGHLSLIKAAGKSTDFVVVSLFVNPLQFNNPEDLEKYPRDLENDILLLEKSGCDLLFAPSVEEMYPENTPKIELDIKNLDSIMEGKMRKGHFDGVVQVLYRLFSVVKPDEVFFGLKDYQQCMVVKCVLKAYFPEIKLSLEPTVRETSGLAMSSRNQRLSKEGQEKAAEIFKTLSYCKSLYPLYTPQEIISRGKEMFKKSNIETEYLEIADSDNLNFPVSWEKNKNYIILAAVYIESVRLIDNLFIN